MMLGAMLTLDCITHARGSIDGDEADLQPLTLQTK